MIKLTLVKINNILYVNLVLIIGEIELKKVKFSKTLKLYIILFFVLVSIIISILVIYDKIYKQEKPFENTSLAMGTYVQQTVYGKKSELAAKAAIKDISDLENLISWRIENSQIAKINSNAGEDWVSLDGKTLDILLKSVDVSKKSMGYYDLTILPISNLWDFGGDNQKVPSIKEIENNLPLVGYKNLKINEDVKRAKLLEKGSGIDLGAVGKGTACDVAIESYKNNGADYGLIAVGGSIGVYGTKPNKTPWNIAIRNPFKGLESTDSIAIIKIRDGFLSTSGSYEKCFEENGTTYHHILNPKTGYPVETDLVAVTVLHSNGTMSDLLSTACFVLGKESSIPILEHYGAQAIFIDKNKNIYATDKILNNITVVNEEYKICDWQ